MTFGIIIHYGLYSYYGYDDINSAKRRKTQNGSEWYYGRLIDNNDFVIDKSNITTLEITREQVLEPKVVNG